MGNVALQIAQLLHDRLVEDVLLDLEQRGCHLIHSLLDDRKDQNLLVFIQNPL